MFDYRYHALSLVAVFIALAVGVVLGVAIGDQRLVSRAESGVERSLRQNVRDAQAQSAGLGDRLNRRDRFDRELYPLLVANRLPGRRVAVLGLGELSDSTVREVKNALEDTGGSLVGVGVIHRPLDLPGLAQRLTGTRYAALASGDPKLVEAFGRRVGRSLRASGAVLTQVRAALLKPPTNGSLARVDGVVLARATSGLGGDDASALDAFERGLVAGLAAAPGGAAARTGAVVGVEETTTRSSQIGWYSDHGLPSVDDIDELPGRAALVLALSGRGTGAYGTKSTAEDLLPAPPPASP